MDSPNSGSKYIDDIKAEALDVAKSIDFWFRKQYRLSPADPRYLNVTREEMLVDWYAYQIIDRMRELAKDGHSMHNVTLEMIFEDETYAKKERELDEQIERELAAKGFKAPQKLRGHQPPDGETKPLISFKATTKPKTVSVPIRKTWRTA